VLLIRLVLYEPLELLPDAKQGHCQVGQDDRIIVVYGDFQLVAEVEFEEGVWLHFVWHNVEVQLTPKAIRW
jgi:hypothetical protein